MKRVLQIIPVVLILLLTAPGINAQNCNFYLPLVENSGLVYENYNRRDRLEGSQQVVIKSVRNEADRVVATVHARHFDRRERVQHEGEYDVICQGDHLRIDIQSLLDQSVLEGFSDMELEIEGDELVLPSGLSEGQDLPDAAMKVSIRSGGMQFAEMTLKVENRRVLGRETIEVPAGTFDAYKISYETHIETRAVGIPIRTRTKTIEYHVEDLGMVRSEYFNDNDRPQGYTVLSRII